MNKRPKNAMPGKVSPLPKQKAGKITGPPGGVKSGKKC